MWLSATTPWLIVAVSASYFVGAADADMAAGTSAQTVTPAVTQDNVLRHRELGATDAS
ncbi:hypothetical protein GCM10029964_044580 [Kibdelosporangium lantanae]